MSDPNEEKPETTKLRRNMRIIEHTKDRRERTKKYADLGLCGTCLFLHAEVTKYGTRRQWCTNLRRGITASDPIMECTDFEEAGKMPLSLLMEMAVPIEAKRTKKIGFIYSMDHDIDPDDGDYNL